METAEILPEFTPDLNLKLGTLTSYMYEGHWDEAQELFFPL
jgi:hypothetical protein